MTTPGKITWFLSSQKYLLQVPWNLHFNLYGRQNIMCSLKESKYINEYMNITKILSSLLPPGFFKLLSYMELYPMLAIASLIRWIPWATLPITCHWPHCSRLCFLSCFHFSLCSFQPKSFATQCFLSTWSFFLSLKYASLFHVFSCVIAVSLLIQIQHIHFSGWWDVPIGTSLLSALMVRTSDFKIYLKLYWDRNRDRLSEIELEIETVIDINIDMDMSILTHKHTYMNPAAMS